MITIKNERLTVEIAEYGAELQRVTGKNGEYLWHGDPAWWGGRAPILFPAVGWMPDRKFTFEGKTYEFPKHGFARTSTFAVEAVDENKAVLLLTDSDETRAIYPFPFELRVTYEVVGDTLAVTHRVSNTGATPLYMAIGAHEAYACPEGIEAYDIVLPEPRTLDSHLVEDAVIVDKTVRMLTNGTVLPLKNEYFEVDALVFKHPEISNLTLRNRQTGRGVLVEIGDAPYLLVWTVPNAPFVCIEPWWGIAHCEGDDPDITRKQGIRTVAAGESFERTHRITVL